MRCFYVLKKWSSAKLSLNRDLSLNKMSLNRVCTVLVDPLFFGQKIIKGYFFISKKFRSQIKFGKNIIFWWYQFLKMDLIWALFFSGFFTVIKHFHKYLWFFNWNPYLKQKPTRVPEDPKKKILKNFFETFSTFFLPSNT